MILRRELSLRGHRGRMAPVPESIILCMVKSQFIRQIFLKCLFPVLCRHILTGRVLSRAICQCFPSIFENLVKIMKFLSLSFIPKQIKIFLLIHSPDVTCRYFYSLVVSVFVYHNQYLFKMFAKHSAIKIRRNLSTLFKTLL